MGKSYSDFKKSVHGQKIDLDGFPATQRYQCWDLANLYFQYIGGHIIHCGLSGYVKDIAFQKKSNGLLDFCVDVGLKEDMKPGDIVVWKPIKPHCPYSHIAIYDHDNGQEEIYFLGQNQPYPYVTVARIPWQGIVGVFRPKIFVNQTPVKPAKRPDQILTVGSKVTSWGFYIQKIDYVRQWGYNSWVGGWFPLKDVTEVDKLDGKQDQIVHIGSGCAFTGTYTVTKVDVPNDRAYLKELGYWIKCRALNEVQEGR